MMGKWLNRDLRNAFFHMFDRDDGQPGDGDHVYFFDFVGKIV